MPYSDEELIAAYIDHFSKDEIEASQSSEEFLSYYDEVDSLTSDDPERLWRITLEMIRRVESDVALACIAAGPLEDLLASQGSLFIERVEIVARQDARFRYALTGVWGNSRFDKDIYARVQKACEGAKKL